jgi:bifunctional oligoribonuclease and PAP phosphatase NrnA
MKTILSQMAKRLEDSGDIFVISHEHPDGDGLGSGFALVLALAERGLKARFGGTGPLPARFGFLPGGDRYLDIETKLPGVPETLVTLDCAALDRTRLPSSFVEAVPTIINIDHHVSNGDFGHLNLVAPDFAATGQLVLRIIEALGVTLSPEMAENLYVSLLEDTGDFNHSNTDAQVFEDAARLVRAGARPHETAYLLHHNLTLPTLRIHGVAQARVELIRPDFISTYVTLEELRRCSADGEHTEGIIETLQHYYRFRIATFFRQDPDGIKASLRSRTDVDVAAVAQRFGGGGHQRAAGCKFSADQSMEVVRQKIHEAILEQLPPMSEG